MSGILNSKPILIILYSKYSDICKKFIDLINNSDIPYEKIYEIKSINIDNIGLRKYILTCRRIPIKYFPAIIIYNHSISQNIKEETVKYEGSDAFGWFNTQEINYKHLSISKNSQQISQSHLQQIHPQQQIPQSHLQSQISVQEPEQIIGAPPQQSNQPYIPQSLAQGQISHSQGQIGQSQAVTDIDNIPDTYPEVDNRSSYPEANIPQVNMPQGNIPQVNMPQGNMPQGNIPQVNTPIDQTSYPEVDNRSSYPIMKDSGNYEIQQTSGPRAQMDYNPSRNIRQNTSSVKSVGIMERVQQMERERQRIEDESTKNRRPMNNG